MTQYRPVDDPAAMLENFARMLGMDLDHTAAGSAISHTIYGSDLTSDTTPTIRYMQWEEIRDALPPRTQKRVGLLIVPELLPEDELIERLRRAQAIMSHGNYAQ